MMLSLLSREAIGVPALRRLYRDLSPRETFAPEAISALRQLDRDCAWRAIWLLNQFVREHGLSTVTVAAICEEAAGLTHWLARLHVCQLLSRTGCPAPARDAVFPFLCDCAADRRVVIRAWAVCALSSFATDPEYRLEIRRILKKAQTDPAKAMQARLRQMKRAARSRSRSGQAKAEKPCRERYAP